MLDFVKKLFEDNVISEDMKSEIESAWQGRIEENREQVTAMLREEFAQKYEHDKSSLVEAVESMLADRLSAELGELAEDRQGLIEARARYAKKMKDDSKAMESFIVDALAKEIAEFHSDKKDLAETKVKLVRESKAKFEAIKKEFIARSSQIIEETVSKGLKSEMKQLKEDIEAARRNDFGRRIFESFASEYAASHLNEKSETAKLLKVLVQREQELEEAAKIVADTQKLVESREAQLRTAKDTMARKEVMSELLNPLSGDKKVVMRELLESVQTDKLRNAYDKYIPSVMNGGNTPVKKALTEGKEITGDKNQAQQFSSEEKTAEIFDIRRLAGLKV